MTQQDVVAPTVAALRTSEERGDERIRRVMQMDLTLLPFPVKPGWYEGYWYGDHSASIWGVLATKARWLCREVRRAGSEVARAVSYLDLSHSPHDPSHSA